MPRKPYYQYEVIIGPGLGPKYENAVHEVERYLEQNGRKISTKKGINWISHNWKFGDTLIITYGDRNNYWEAKICTTGLAPERVQEVKEILRNAAGFKT